MITNMASITAVDSAATPVTHTFTPASRVAENEARWQDREHNDGVAIGYATVKYSLRDPLKNDKVPVYRQKVSFEDPIVDRTSPTAPVLVAVPRANTEFIFPAVMSQQQRDDFVAKYWNLMRPEAPAGLGDNIAAQQLPY